MPIVTNLAGKAQDQFRSAIKQAGEATVSAVSTVSGLVANVIPQLPSLPVSIPEPKEVVKATFTVAEKALKAQKNYALDIAKALEPVTLKIAQNGKRRSSKA